MKKKPSPQEIFKKIAEEVCHQFLTDLTTDDKSVFVMPDGPAKKKVEYMISQCKNSPESALALCLMSLGDCYGKIARLSHKQDGETMDEMQKFFNEESPMNNLIYRFVTGFDEIRPTKN